MRYRLDRSVRRMKGDRVVLGGSPTRLFRLTDAGAELFAHLAAGRPVRSTRGSDALVSRWVDAGVVHPRPEPDTGSLDVAAVTVVIPVRDRTAELDALLGSLRVDAATTGSSPAAVVVVDDGSAVPIGQDGPSASKGAPEPVGAAAVTVLRHDTPLGPGAGRNTGARVARTELVAFLDSDCAVEPGWLEPLLGHFEDPAVAAVAQRVVAIDPVVVDPVAVAPAASVGRGSGVLFAYERERSPLDLGVEPGRVQPGTRISYVPSAALVVRRDAFDSIGGFDESLRVGEDVDLVWRLVGSGHRVRYEPRSRVGHATRPDLASWIRQRVGYGESAAALDRRHPGSVAPAVWSRWSLGVGVLVLGGHPLLGAGLAAGTVEAMRRKLPDLPLGEVARLVLGGHLGAVRQAARATVRVWWPVAIPAAMVSRRARRLTSVAVGLVAAEALAGRRRAPGASPDVAAPTFAALAVLDDLAYGAGVWRGCIRHRSFRALRPSMS